MEEIKVDEDLELRKKFSRVLGAPSSRGTGVYDSLKQITYSWEEIFNEIGKLQERANKPAKIEYVPYQVPQPQTPINPAGPIWYGPTNTPCSICGSTSGCYHVTCTGVTGNRKDPGFPIQGCCSN